MEDAIIHMAEVGSVHNIYPMISTGDTFANKGLVALHTVSKLIKQPALMEVDVNDQADAEIDWKRVSRRNIWVVLRLDTADVSVAIPTVLRHAAVSVLCARTNDCNPNFKLWLVLHPALFHKLPRLALHLCSLGNKGQWTALDCDNASLLHGDLEFWESFSHSPEEDAAAVGPIADLQEDVFNSKEDITEVKYDPALADGANYIKIMRDALKFNLCVKTLDMSRSLGGDIIGYCLTSVLHSSRKLQRLVLDECSLTDVGIGQLSKALVTNPFITELSLERNPGIGDMGIMALAAAISSPASRLKILNLSRNNSLYTEEKQWTTDALNALWDALGENKFITEVKLCECGILDRDAEQAASRWLSKASQLEVLNIRDNALGDSAVALILDVAPQLRCLDLSHTGLSAAGFRSLGVAVGRKEFSKLEWISMDSNNALRVVDLEEASLNPAMSPEMKQALLWKPKVGEEDPISVGATAIDIMLNAFDGNAALKTVHFSKVNFGDKGVEKLLDLLLAGRSKIDHIDISFNCNIEEESSHKVKEILCGGYYDTPEVAVEGEPSDEPPPVVQNLETLSIAGNATSVGERAILALYRNEHLQHLDVSDMALVDGMLLPLSEGAQTNKNLKLRSISLRRNFILRSGLKTIAEFVQFSQTLVHLDISEIWESFTDDAGRPSKLTATKEEGLYYFRALIAVLEQQPSPTLRVLDVSHDDIGNVVGKALATAIAGNMTLEKIVVRGNPALSPEAVLGCRQMVF